MSDGEKTGGEERVGTARPVELSVGFIRWVVLFGLLTYAITHAGTTIAKAIDRHAQVMAWCFGMEIKE